MKFDIVVTNADIAVRPFQVQIADEAIADLRQRIAAWQPPEREPVDDQSQGVQLTAVQDLARYWATHYDWRRCEAKPNPPLIGTRVRGLNLSVLSERAGWEPTCSAVGRC